MCVSHTCWFYEFQGESLEEDLEEELRVSEAAGWELSEALANLPPSPAPDRPLPDVGVPEADEGVGNDVGCVIGGSCSLPNGAEY